MAIKQVAISVFPRDEGFWRLDWLDRVAYLDRTVRYSQPSVVARLSKVRDLDFQDDHDRLLAPESTSHRYQKSCWLSVGTLPYLTVGSIWRNQRLVLEPAYQEQVLDINVSPATTNFIKAGLNLNETGFLLPLSEHPWHLKSTQSYCVMVSLGLGRQLVIPCLELARFYFGSSSRLLTQLFTPPLEEEKLFTKIDYDEAKRYLDLTLAPGLSGCSASDIGRLALSKSAWTAASMVGTSMQQAAAAMVPIYIRTGFPFTGKTTLKVRGKWLSHGGKADATFVVFSILSCSHPFPFKSLQYKTIDDGLKKRRLKLPPQPIPEGAASIHASQPSSKPQLTEKEPSTNLKGITRFVKRPVRFPDLTRKKVWKEQAIEVFAPHPVSAHIADSDEEATASHQISSSTSRARSVDFAQVSAETASTHKPPPFLRRALAALKRADENLSIQLLTASDEDGWTIPIPTIADEDGVIHPRVMTRDGKQRRCSLFELRQGQRHLHLVVIDAFPPFVHTAQGRAGQLTQDETVQAAAQSFLNLSLWKLFLPRSVSLAIYRWVRDIDDKYS